jgi:putative ABC transport system permease protein
MDSLLQDIRYAVRLLLRTPAFTLAAAVSLAVGIGATTALFSAVNGVLLEPLPLPDAERVVFTPRVDDVEADVGIPDMVDLRARTTQFAALAAFAPGWAFDLTGQGEPERLTGAVIESQFFAVLGLEPLRGRLFTERDDQPGAPRVALVAEAYWRGRLAADPAIVGRSLTLSGQATTIIGVMPDAADIMAAGWDVYLPLAVEMPWALNERGSNHLEVLGRLRPDATVERATAELDAVTRDLAGRFPRTNDGKILRAVPLHEFVTADSRTTLLVLLGAVALVLLITCVNLTNFLLARSTVRRGELAVRQALGAGRRRLVRQLLVESLILSLAGGVGGVLLAVWGRDLLVAVAPEGLPRAANIALDGRVLAFALGLTTLAGLIVGLAPALSAGRTDPAEAVAASGTRGGGGRWRQRRLDALVAAQVAIALVLLVGSGLLLRSLRELLASPLGFDPVNVTQATLVLPEQRYADMAAQTRAFTGMVEAARAIPGVTHAAYVIGAPMHGSLIGHATVVERPGIELTDGAIGARVRPVIGDYFGLMSIPVLQGRGFTAADRAGALPVAIVNRHFAEQLWPGQNPIGQRIAFRVGEQRPWMTVVGVVGDVKATALTEGDSRAVYFPYEQRTEAWQRFGVLLVRTRDGATGVTRALHQAVWSVDPSLPLEQVVPLADRVRAAAGRERFAALLLTAFALAALVVAVQGIYATLAYAVSVRRREIGIRVALGATKPAVVGLVLTGAARAALAGIALGTLGGLYATRAVRTMLYGVEPNDAATFAAAAGTLAVVALLAGWLPARRAARVDPMTALRSE